MDSTESTPSPSFSDLAADSGAKKMMSVAEMMRKIQAEPLTSGDEEEDDAEDNDGKIIKDNDGKILDLAKVVPGAASAGGGLTTHSQVKSIEQLKNVQLYEKSSMDVLAWEPPNGKKSIVAKHCRGNCIKLTRYLSSRLNNTCIRASLQDQSQFILNEFRGSIS